MKVFIITTSTFPNGMADTNRIKCYSKAILSKNIECEIVIYKRNKGFDNSSSEGIADGIRYRYVGGNSIRSSFILISRFFDVWDRVLLSFYLMCHSHSNDVVFCYGSLYTPFLIDLMHLKKVKFVANLTEYPFLYSKRSTWKRIYELITLKLLFPRYDGIIAISDELVTFAKKFCSKQCVIIKIPILVEFVKYNRVDISFDKIDKYIFHAGSLHEGKDGILGMIEAFGKYKNSSATQVKFISTGKIEISPHAKQISDLIKLYNLKDDIIFKGYLKDDEYQRYLQGASLVIINKIRSVQNKYCFSTKLGEYMAAEKAIIITNVGEAMNWVHDREDVFVVDSANTDILANAIRDVLNDDETRRRVSKQARVSCLRMFDYKQYGDPIINFFYKVTCDK